MLLILDEVQSGPRPHRALVRLPARGHPARRADPRQGARRRRLPGLRLRRRPRELMSVFDPGSHGSTFGGNALAARIGLEALDVIEEEGLVERSGRARRLSARRACGRCAATSSPTCAAGACGSASRSIRHVVSARVRLRRARRRGRPVEGHPRHRPALRAAAHHHPRGDRLGHGARRARLRPRVQLMPGRTDLVPEHPERTNDRRPRAAPRGLPAAVRHGGAALRRHLDLHAAAASRADRRRRARSTSRSSAFRSTARPPTGPARASARARCARPRP